MKGIAAAGRAIEIVGVLAVPREACERQLRVPRRAHVAGVRLGQIPGVFWWRWSVG